ncbi:MAG: Asp-tRNA(Asn)/Glu-tRNA(Gln) amidotransferase GatCAB subunit C [Clostridiales bacterium]|nr:MAG: Asp-tRNA(Asn)/Glu-tRNA(Gln) amidotransferase GatCAB subunit C [Clostridiales bacterium]
MRRTEYCGKFGEQHMGTCQQAAGWVQKKRDMGGVIFLDLKDREGVLQVVCDASLLGEQFAAAERVHLQSVVQVSGRIRRRSEETYNPRLATGTVELAAEQLEVLSEAGSLPFSMEEDAAVREDLRLQYRYLDLRRSRMYRNLRFRHAVQKAAQDYLDADGFLFVETPMLTKSTPEGARDYLVPSRVHPGSYYALPQSPQIFKQLLMVGGIDKYYQVARCFRDEDLRADRQPEFTQVDMELSFVDQEDVLRHLEKLFRHIMRTVKGVELPAFPRITWQQAMDWYGSDKPDIRYDLRMHDLTDLAARSSFTLFRKVAEQGGVVRAICVKGGAAFTRSQIDDLTERAIGYGAGGMAWIALRPDGIYSILTKYFSEEQMQELLREMQAEEGDFILFCADRLETVRRVLGSLRQDIADLQGLKDPQDYRFLIVQDFPQFEYSREEQRWVAMHHPFTMPYPEDMPYLFSDPGRVRAQAYDVVLNGVELGSGSVRIHRSDVQQQMFRALGFGDEEIEQRFGFMVHAFGYGTPPHAGFAFGLDRLVMLLLGEQSLREVIAFPKIKDASCPMTQAPAQVDPAQLAVLGLAMRGEGEGMQAAQPGRKGSPMEVERVAQLAKLRLPPEQKQAMAAQLSSIVDFAGQLAAADTASVEAAGQVGEQENVWREDAVTNADRRDQLLAASPSREGGYIVVPRVVE